MSIEIVRELEQAFHAGSPFPRLRCNKSLLFRDPKSDRTRHDLVAVFVVHGFHMTPAVQHALQRSLASGAAHTAGGIRWPGSHPGHQRAAGGENEVRQRCVGDAGQIYCRLSGGETLSETPPWWHGQRS